MKNFFSNKTNILLLGIISVLVISAIGIGLIILKPDNSIKAIDFSNSSTVDVSKWCADNNIDSSKCIINYEYSDTVENGKLIYQSVKENEVIDDGITFVFSKGKEETKVITYIDLIKIDNTTTKKDVENWVNTNSLTNVTYSEEYNDTIAEGIVVKIEPNSNISVDTKITVTISKGKKAEVITKKTFDIEEGYYYGISETAFENKAKELGLVALHNPDNDAYSLSINKGEVIWHGHGTYEEGENFRYSLSLGSKDGLETVEIKKDELLNIDEDEFVKKINDLGLNAIRVSSLDENSTSVNKGKVISYEYGKYYKDETIRYGLSLGLSYPLTIKENEFVDISLDKFKEVAKEYGLNPTHKEEWDQYSDTIEKGKIVKNGYSTDYQKNDNWSYGLSLGKKDSSSVTYPVTIKENAFVGKSLDDLKEQATAYGLKAVHNESWDAYSDSVEKGKIIRNGYGEYDKNEEWRYGLSLGKKDSSTTISYPLTISSGSYTNISLDDFKSKANEFGLKETHNSDWDNYSDTIAKGYIIKHGSGSYDKNEEWRYGLSLGKKDSTSISYPVTIKDKEYVGKTESEFKTVADSLGLKAIHNESWDAYSDSIAKGSIIRHGYTEFDKGESWRYGLSLGKKEEPVTQEKVTVNANAYVGKSVDEFTSAMQSLGLKVSHVSSNDKNSSSIEKGKILSHDSGSFEKGSTITYSKSLGQEETITVASGYEGKSEQEFKNYISGLGLDSSKTGSENSSTIAEGCVISYTTGSFSKGYVVTYVLSKGEATSRMLGKDVLNQLYLKDTTNADDAINILKATASLSQFSNVTYNKISTGNDEDKGKIETLTVNGVEDYNTKDPYPVSTPIVITISTGKN